MMTGQREPKRVLYFITELNVGGAERSLARLLAGLDRAQFAPTVACLYGSDSPVADDIRALGLPVFSGAASGPAALFGPTGGYLLGFVIAAYVVGYLETVTAYLISPAYRTIPALLLLVVVMYVRPQGLFGRR